MKAMLVNFSILEKAVTTSGLVTYNPQNESWDYTRGHGTSHLYEEEDGTVRWPMGYPPAALIPYVTRIEGNMFFTKEPRRKRGEYEPNESARGVLELVHTNQGGFMYRLDVVANSLESAEALCRRVRIGNIEPTVSYEEEQTGMPSREKDLEKQLELYHRLLAEQGRLRHWPFRNPSWI
ncbi:MAG TPA: hypothetical protein VJJ22_00790 [Candidatus Paceibacterota bacterium]